MQPIIDFLLNHWQIIAIIIFVIDKIVMIIPGKYDDMIWTALRWIIYKLTGKTDTERPT